MERAKCAWCGWRARHGKGWKEEWRRDRGCAGQATLEYALVLLAFVALLIAGVALWHAVRDGRFARIGGHASSHSLEDPLPFAQDLALY